MMIVSMAILADDFLQTNAVGEEVAFLDRGDVMLYYKRQISDHRGNKLTRVGDGPPQPAVWPLPGLH